LRRVIRVPLNPFHFGNRKKEKEKKEKNEKINRWKKSRLTRLCSSVAIQGGKTRLNLGCQGILS